MANPSNSAPAADSGGDILDQLARENATTMDAHGADILDQLAAQMARGRSVSTGTGRVPSSSTGGFGAGQSPVRISAPGAGINRFGQLDEGSGLTPNAPFKNAQGRWSSANPAPDWKLYWRAMTSPTSSAEEKREGFPLPGAVSAFHNTAGRFASDLASPLIHPIQAIESPFALAAEVAHPTRGPIADRVNEFRNEFHQNKPLAFENALGDAAATLEGSRIASDVPGAKTVAHGARRAAGAPVRAWADRFHTVPGENFTPIQQHALSAVLARGASMGKGFIPQNVAADAGSAIRETAAAHPDLARAVNEGTPEDAIGAFHEIVRQTKQRIDAQHNAALGPVADTPIDMSDVQSAVRFPQNLAGYAPEDAAAAADLRARLGTIHTLGGLNELRMRLAEELSPQFRKAQIDAGKSPFDLRAKEDEYAAVRNLYYRELENATGINFQPMKRLEGATMEAQGAIENAAPQLFKSQAMADEPRGLKGTTADIAEGGSGSTRTGALAGIGRFVGQKVLGQKPLNVVQGNLQRFLQKLPSAPYEGPLSEPFSPSVLRHRLPREVIPNAEFGAEPEPDNGFPGQPPIEITRPAPAGQLPANAGPTQAQFAGTPSAPGIPPGGFRVFRAKRLPAPQPEANPTLNVAPNGEARFGPRGLLRAPEPTPLLEAPKPEPPPAIPLPPSERVQIDQINSAVDPGTKTFDLSKWKQQNPGADAEQATRLARSLGYRVTDQLKKTGFDPQTHVFSGRRWKAAHPKGNVGAMRAKMQKEGYRVID